MAFKWKTRHEWTKHGKISGCSRAGWRTLATYTTYIDML